MKKLLIPVLSLLLTKAAAQDDLTEKAQPIVKEGRRLYRLEMASWYGTDIFLEKYKDQASIGGYFSYIDKDTTRCIFYNKTPQPTVLGTISFDETFTVAAARADLTHRPFSEAENEVYGVRLAASKVVNTDTIFKTYKNTSLNIIPVIDEAENKVYVLTGPKNNGVVIFGNDYLITFDKKNKLTATRSLHKNIIPIYYDKNRPDSSREESTIHSHLPETGDYITATDICTLMLYGKFTTWKQHNVVSKNYLNTWKIETNELFVIPMSTIQKIMEDQEKRKGKEN